ncbi:DUF1489 domain-containing protein [Caulobacter sp. 17J65-9]|uniref:DUF1489 family protein n=1 Tax=Caulobacter sp. 17J65-9 TaxID=2709382 RepID=UPI0013CDCB86|nr:DUF1489 domain-containing protein [Caulobacter sp. 17J65-9]NEX93667.1 DUF1489 domain-containing protein [Caulobacter sp. 17J65-9]
MPLHLVKLCVGVERIEQLTAWGRAERGKGRVPMVHTRQTPKRADELIEGGSLYWVIKGVILCRQQILKVETFEEGGQNRCEITLHDDVIPTAPQPRRAFQGWRYFEAKDVPPDLSTGDAGEMPLELARELRALGAW